jgi:hypothetical protein
MKSARKVITELALTALVPATLVFTKSWFSGMTRAFASLLQHINNSLKHFVVYYLQLFRTFAPIFYTS